MPPEDIGVHIPYVNSKENVSKRYIGKIIVYYSTSNHKRYRLILKKICAHRAFWRNGSYAPEYILQVLTYPVRCVRPIIYLYKPRLTHVHFKTRPRILVQRTHEV